MSSSVTSKSKSAALMASSAWLAEPDCPSMSLLSLSCSTTTHSGDSWVANLMRSLASWSVGSTQARNSRLPRLFSGSTWYCPISLASMMFLGRRCASTASRSSSGTASAEESAWAS